MRSLSTYFIFLVYVLCNFLMLLNKGVFWDDWTVFNMQWGGLKEEWTNNGLIFPMYVYNFLNHLPDPVLWFRLTSFTIVLLSVILFIRIVKWFEILNPQELFFLGLLMASMPLFSARILLISFQYSICLLSFLCAFLLLLKYFDKRLMLYRVGALLLFFFSFLINSLLVFYITVPLLIIGRQKLTVKTLLHFADFMVLPILFWIVKLKLLKPGGLHALEDYNNITLKNLISSPIGLWESFRLSFLELCAMTVETLTEKLSLAVIFFTILFGVSFSKISFSGSSSQQYYLFPKKLSRNTVLLASGIILFMIGSLPYVLVNKIPSFQNFNTRNQLLLSMGSSFLLLSATQIMIKEGYRKFVYAFIVASFILINYNQFLNYQKDTFRQAAIVENLRLTDLKTSHTIMVIDSTHKFVESETSQIVYTGMAKFVTGEQTRLVIAKAKAEQWIKDYGSLSTFRLAAESLNLKDWEPSDFDSKLIIRNGNLDLTSTSNTFKLLYYQWIHPDVFRHEIINGVSLELQRI